MMTKCLKCVKVSSTWWDVKGNPWRCCGLEKISETVRSQNKDTLFIILIFWTTDTCTVDVTHEFSLYLWPKMGHSTSIRVAFECRNEIYCAKRAGALSLFTTPRNSFPQWNSIQTFRSGNLPKVTTQGWVRKDPMETMWSYSRAYPAGVRDCVSVRQLCFWLSESEWSWVCGSANGSVRYVQHSVSAVLRVRVYQTCLSSHLDLTNHFRVKSKGSEQTWFVSIQKIWAEFE